MQYGVLRWLVLLSGAVLAARPAQVRGEDRPHVPPRLAFDNPEMAKLVTVYGDAIRNLVETNTVHLQGHHVIHAGTNYPKPWTRRMPMGMGMWTSATLGS